MAPDLDAGKIDRDPTLHLWRECPTLLWLRVARARAATEAKSHPMAAAAAIEVRPVWEALAGG